MNDHDADERKIKARRVGFSSFGQRLLTLVLFAFLACLIWLAITGQYDAQVDQFAGWLHRHFETMRRMF